MALSNYKRAQIMQHIIIAGTSNREIARRVGCSESTVRRYRGTRMTQIDIRITRGTGVQQSYMMRLRDDREPTSY